MPDQKVSVLAILEDQFSGPLGKIRTGLSNLVGKFVDVERGGRVFRSMAGNIATAHNALTRLTGGPIGQLIAAYGALNLAQRSLAEAEESAKAQRQLTAALDGQADKIRELNALTEKYAELLGISDEEQQEAVALMKNGGAAVDDLSRGLEAAIVLSSKFPVSLQGAAKALVTIDEGGGRAIATLVPGLKELQREGVSTADAIAFILKTFGGVSDLPRDTFTKLAGDTQAFDNALKPLGDRIAEIKLAFLEELLPIAKQVGEFFESPQGQAIATVFKNAIPLIVRVITILAGFVAGAGLLKLVALVTSIPVQLALAGVKAGLLLLAFNPMVLVVGALVAGILHFTGLLGKAATAIGGLLGDAKKGADDFKDGLAEAIQLFTSGQIDADTFFDYLGKKVDGLELRAENLIDKIRLALRPIGDFFDDLLAKVPRLLTTGLAGSAGGTSFVSAEDLATGQKLTEEELFRRLNEGFIGPVLESSQDEVQARVDAFEKASAKISEEATKLLEDGKKKKAAADKEQVASEQTKADKIVAIDKDLQERIDAVLSDGAVFNFAAAQESLDKLDAKAAELRTKIQALVGSLRGEGTPEVPVTGTREQQLALLLSLTQQLEETDRQRAQHAKDLTEARQRELEFNLRNLALIDAEFTAVEARRAAGDISQGAVTGAAQEAIEKFRAEIAALEAQLPLLGEGSQQFREMALRIDEAKRRLEELEDREDFGKGIRQGVIAATRDVQTLGQVGQQVGQELTQNIAGGLSEAIVDAFAQGTVSLQRFLAEFLRTTAIMITRLLILRGIGGIFGGAFLNSGGAVGLNRGGRVQHFDVGGGVVPGPNVNADVVPAMLTPDEYVLNQGANRSVAGTFGRGFMDDVNARGADAILDLLANSQAATRALFSVRTSRQPDPIFPRHFALGGPVTGPGPSVPSRTSAPVPAVLVANEQAAERMYAGGPNAFRRALEQNSTFLKSLVSR